MELVVAAGAFMGLRQMYKSRITHSVTPAVRLQTLTNGSVPTTVMFPWHELQYVDFTEGETVDEVVANYQNFQLERTQQTLSCADYEPLQHLF
jgi:hypothetical protein